MHSSETVITTGITCKRYHQHQWVVNYRESTFSEEGGKEKHTYYWKNKSPKGIWKKEEITLSEICEINYYKLTKASTFWRAMLLPYVVDGRCETPFAVPQNYEHQPTATLLLFGGCCCPFSLLELFSLHSQRLKCFYDPFNSLCHSRHYFPLILQPR